MTSTKGKRTMTSNVTVICGDSRANLHCAVAYRGTLTRGSGQANLALYDVEIGDYTLDGSWNNDARNKINVEIAADHPLAIAIQKIARVQQIGRNIREMRGDAPIGWSKSEWQDKQRDERSAYADANAAMKSDAVAMSLLATPADLAS